MMIITLTMPNRHSYGDVPDVAEQALSSFLMEYSSSIVASPHSKLQASLRFKIFINMLKNNFPIYNEIKGLLGVLGPNRIIAQNKI